MSEADKLAVTKGAASTATELAGRADKMAAAATSSAAELRKQVGELMNLEFQIAEKQRTTLRQIAEFSSLMQSEGATQSAIEIAVASLGQAIAALQAVTAILNDAAKFWRAMEAKCMELSSDNLFLTKIQTLKTRDPGELVSEVRRATFVKGAVQYIAGWTALESIAADYRTELGILGQTLSGYVSQHPSEEKARTMAVKMAKELGIDVSELIKAETAKAERAERISKAIAAEPSTPPPEPAPAPVQAG